MTPGLFDLPAPLLQWVDDRLSTLIPAPVSVAVWGVVGAIVCLEFYRLLSPQQRIGEIKQEAGAAQRRLASYDGEFEGAWPLMKHLLGLSLKRVGIVLPATLAAAYPVLVLLVWLSNSYGYYFPGPAEEVDVDIAAPLEARWLNGSEREPPRIRVRKPDNEVILDIPVAAPVPTLHKRVWWNWLMANPAGYLPREAPVDEIGIDLPRQELLSLGPKWLHGWEAIFVPVLFIAALGYKSARHIH